MIFHFPAGTFQEIFPSAARSLRSIRRFWFISMATMLISRPGGTAAE